MLRFKLSTGYLLVESQFTSTFATCIFFCVVAKKEHISAYAVFVVAVLL